VKIAAKVSYCNDYVSGKESHWRIFLIRQSNRHWAVFLPFRFGVVHETRWIWAFEKRKPGYEYNVGRAIMERKGREKKAHELGSSLETGNHSRW